MRLLGFISSLLPTLFWGLIIFGFEEPYMAIMTIICALIHEGGHLLFTEAKGPIRGVVSGFRIRTGGIVSYRQRILTYLGGPMANLLVCLFCLPATVMGNEYIGVFSLINLVTALSNLMPIEGYDGYGILMTLIEMRELDGRFHSALIWLSNSIIMVLTVFSLCLIDRVGGGYWIFAVFFSYLVKVVDRGLFKEF